MRLVGAGRKMGSGPAFASTVRVLECRCHLICDHLKLRPALPRVIAQPRPAATAAAAALARRRTGAAFLSLACSLQRDSGTRAAATAVPSDAKYERGENTLSNAAANGYTASFTGLPPPPAVPPQPPPQARLPTAPRGRQLHAAAGCSRESGWHAWPAAQAQPAPGGTWSGWGPRAGSGPSVHRQGGPPAGTPHPTPKAHPQHARHPQYHRPTHP